MLVLVLVLGVTLGYWFNKLRYLVAIETNNNKKGWANHDGEGRMKANSVTYHISLEIMAIEVYKSSEK